jgi:sulfite reductase (ferredoxin)
MMRVRTDGALLGPEQLRALGSASTEFARDTADITDRQNIQYHWVAVEDVPAIWQRLEAVGLETQEACGDSPRPFLGSPVAGVAADEIIDGSPALREIGALHRQPAFSNSPQFKTARLATRATTWPRGQRRLVRRHGPPSTARFDLWAGGGLSNPMLAQKLGVWIPLD